MTWFGRSSRWLLASLVLALVGCGKPVLEPLPRDATILAFGDSPTKGVVHRTARPILSSSPG